MIDKSDYKEPVCPFDTDFYKDKSPAPSPKGHISVSEMISQIDRLYAKGDKAAAIRVLEQFASAARRLDDINGELSCINEMIGAYRMSGDSERGLAAVARCFELLKSAGISGSVSAGTILLNAATALRAFGHAAEAIKHYTEACRCYGANLDASDKRFAGLYNNMAAAYEDTDEYMQAERYYKLALSVLSKYESDEVCMLDCAVTHLNLAQFYISVDATDARANEHAEKAIKILDESFDNKSYYAHTAEKCAGGFDYLGYFMYADELRERVKSIYNERT